MRRHRKQRVLLIGWDAADWKIISPLIDAGKMPTLARFVEGGVMGNLATLYPDLSPMLWTSIATGKRPFKHGVLGFTEPDPRTGHIRPVSVLSRKTRAIWNILTQQGLRSVVVGWWPSHPAEPINGVMVSDLFHKAVAPHGKSWPMRPGAVHPRRLVRNLAELRQHPQEVDPGLVQLFVPKLAEIDQEKDKRVETLAKTIAECTTIKNAACAIMHHEPWDFAAVYFDAIDHFCHAFMHYHPPKLPWTSDEDYERYQMVVESGYIYHDILLGHLLREVDDETTVLLISDHGFHSDHLRPASMPHEPAGPAAQHRHYGIFAARGPGVKQDEIIYGAGLLDVCPTILSLFDLPMGEDMDGKPLVNIFADPPVVATIPSWDDAPGDGGMHPWDATVDTVDAAEAMQQLVDLGYIEAPPDNRQEAVDKTVRELQYNKARSYMDALRYAEAAELLQTLYERWPGEYRFGVALANCLVSMGRTAEARELIQTLLEAKSSNSKKARARLQEIAAARKDVPQDETPDEKLQKEIRDLRAEADMPVYALSFLAGSIFFETGDSERALIHLQTAMQADAGQVTLFVKLGDVYLKMRRLEEAGKAFEQGLELDPESSAAWLGMARVHLRAKRNREAAEAAMTSVGLIFHNPVAHFTLGMALSRLGYVDRAVTALNLAAAQNPNFARAWSCLAFVHRRLLHDPDEAAKCLTRAREAAKRVVEIKNGAIDLSVLKDVQSRAALSSDLVQDKSHQVPARKKSMDEPFALEKTVVLVSGLPRSGTSMMMQMLRAGGMELVTDGKRRADASNPLGYFEHEQVKDAAAYRDFFAGAQGKAVKVVAPLLPRIPPLPDAGGYRVIFMERDIAHIVASQRDMLRRLHKLGAAIATVNLETVFQKQAAMAKRLLSLRSIPTLVVRYDDAVENPEQSAKAVSEFLHGHIDPDQAASVVDASLRRQSSL